MESPLQKMIDRQVIVKTADVTYRGRLVEVGDESVCLMARTGWRDIPVDRIVSIDLAPQPGDAAGKTDFNENKTY